MNKTDQTIPKPVLIDVSGNDIDNIEQWVPDDPNEVSEWVTLTIGPDSTAGDLFQAHICTPREAGRVRDERGLVIVPYYEKWGDVVKSLDEVLEQCRGYDWQDMCRKLRKRLLWEYEGM